MQEVKQTDILLESGTNELEILEFEVGNSVYGINIAKVVEITTAQEIREVPASPEVVEGIYNSRGIIISVVDLYKITHNVHKENERAMFIVCNFNQMTIAFHVGNVRGIQRISWSDIKEPPSITSGAKNQTGLITGIVQVEKQLIMILDFERIISEINADVGLNVTELNTVKPAETKVIDKPIVVVDDSPLLNRMIVESLESCGLHNIKSFKNGAEAWNYIVTQRDGEGKITDRIACVVSDIEMPQMDGHHLTKRIKEDSVLKDIPVYLFSSLINEQMFAKGLSVGADAQFSKPQIAELTVALIEQLSK